MQNDQNELEESSRLFSMLETQLTDLSVEDGLKGKKVVVRFPKENLRFNRGEEEKWKSSQGIRICFCVPSSFNFIETL